MSTLAQLRTRVSLWLKDSSNIAWSAGEIDDAIRQALDEYSQVFPLHMETAITLPSDGREIALDGLPGLEGISAVLEVWWPYSTTEAYWPPNQVAGWRTWWDDSRMVLFLNTAGAGEPQAGDEVRIWYARQHTIQDLDSADATSLPPGGEGLIVEGAAGFAALSGGINRSEVLDLEQVRKWGEIRLQAFRAELERIRRREARSQGQPFGAGWKLDRWDR